jgi:hypothetical protein
LEQVGMNRTTLIERLEAVPERAVFMYKSGALPKMRRGAGELCAEAAREIRRLRSDVAHWMAARHAAIAAGEILYEELKTLRDELKVARDEIERLRAKVDL